MRKSAPPKLSLANAGGYCSPELLEDASGQHHSSAFMTLEQESVSSV
jgi:hypothetical protein